MENISESFCGPFVLYTIFMLALIVFNLTQNDRVSSLRNVVFLFIGSLLLWLLCRMGFEIAAWILISLIPFFFVSLIALLIVTQVIRTEVDYDDGTYKIISGKTLLSYFGYEDFERKKVQRPSGSGPFDVIASPDPSPCDKPEPEAPRLNPVKRVIQQLERRFIPETTCDQCNHE